MVAKEIKEAELVEQPVEAAPEVAEPVQTDIVEAIEEIAAEEPIVEAPAPAPAPVVEVPVAKTNIISEAIKDFAEPVVEATVTELPEEAPITIVNVLNRFRIEKRGDDAVIFERFVVNEEYAGHKGVKEFLASNGKVTYYVEKQVKKYSDNVVSA